MPPETVNLTFTMKSQPFFGEPEGADAYYATLGRAIILWNRFEYVFAMSLQTIANLPGAGLIREPKIEEPIPISFKRRAKMWRRAFNQLPVLADQKEPALKMIDEAALCANNRSILLHSHAFEFTKHEPLTLRFNHAKWKGDTLLIGASEVSLPDLDELSKDFDSIYIQIIALAWNLSALHARLTDQKSEPPA